ncbi:MAG: ABC transporter ATP-binding protein, partial [Verrucomicrobiales bacterium]|nr:ABC transporter ATP-binding protein [Verrucomicrobiales bacterium]
GLDPNQIRAARELIKELGRRHTILLSTHILPEVEMVCGRAIIINRGKIEALDTLGNLSRRVKGGAWRVEVKGADGEALAREFGAVAGVSSVTVSGVKDGWVSLECAARPGENIREALDRFIKRRDLPLREFRRGKASLEDVFIELIQE